MSITTKFIPHSLIGVVSVLPALLVMPAGADAPIVDTNVFVLGDIVLNNQHVANGEAAFVGRRMNATQNGKYKNDFPKYKMVVRSLDMSNSDTYVGPVTLTLTDVTTSDQLKFNYQMNEVDTNLVDVVPALDWNISEEDVVAAGIPQPTAWTIATFAHLDDVNSASAHAAGSLAFRNTTAVVDGATINADSISVTDGSLLSFVMKDTALLNTSNRFYTNAADIISDGVTTLNARVMNVSGSHIDVNSGAELRINASEGLTFANNTTTESGGAISVYLLDGEDPTAVVIDGNQTYTGNNASVVGGAISNAAEGIEMEDGNGGWYLERRNPFTLTGGAVFSGNTAGERGGAIYNNGDMTLNNVTFTNNSTTTDHSGYSYASQGGAIYNSGADEFGAFFMTSNGVLTINGATFGDKNDPTKGNSAIQGGAIANSADETGFGYVGELTLNNVNFYYNKARADSNAEDGYLTSAGGAVWNGDGNITINGDTEFVGNMAEGYATMGGAVWNDEGEITFNDSVTFDSNISNKTIAGNGAQGGAINNEGLISFTKLANFQGNEAVNTIAGPRADLTYLSKGGAIYNETYGVPATITFEKDAIFEANKADLGGAVFNMDGTVVFTESTTFTNNVANADGGAIFNLDEMTFAGENTFSGNTANGVANDIYNAGTLTFAAGSATEMDGGINGSGALTIANGATLNLGTASIVQNTMTLNGTVNADLKNTNEFAFLDVATFTDTTTGKLNLTLKSAGTYNVFKNAVFANTNIADSAVFTYNWNDAGDTITVSTKSASEIVEALNVDAGAANAVVSMANAKDETAQQIGNALAEVLASGDIETVEHEVKKLAPAEKPVTHSVASSVQNQVLTLTASRMAAGVAAGRAGGDEINADYGFWVQGLYNKSKYHGEFDGQSRGVAVGFDALINKIYTLGIGYAFSNSDLDMSDGGSFDIDSHTVFVYGQYKPSQWFINATLSNTVSKYTEKAIVLGTAAETEYDVNAFGIQAMTGYDFASGITPMVGMRYLHVTTDGHERLLGYVDDSTSSFLSAVAGLKYAFDIQDTGDIHWTPELRALATYDVISDKNGATVYLPNGSIYQVPGDRMSRGGGELGAGVTMEWRGLELSLNYDLQLREDYLSHTGMIKLRCEF